MSEKGLCFYLKESDRPKGNVYCELVERFECENTESSGRVQNDFTVCDTAVIFRRPCGQRKSYFESKMDLETALRFLSVTSRTT